MAEMPLAGVSVLVTRPEHQASELVNAIEKMGGIAIRFPTLRIDGHAAATVSAAAKQLPEADIVIFVSSNAVQYGIHVVGAARIAVIGEATAAAVRAADRAVDIMARDGFDSEQLLASAELAAVSGKNITIIRGQDGRELLAETLAARGAQVSYLPVYERCLATPAPGETEALVRQWQAGGIDVVTVMSVASFLNLLALLPQSALCLLARTRLVTPATRVLKQVLTHFPDQPAFLSDGPGPAAMVQAIIQIAPGKPR